MKTKISLQKFFLLLVCILTIYSKSQAVSLTEIYTPDIRFCTLNMFQVKLQSSAAATFSLRIKLDGISGKVLFDTNNVPTFTSACGQVDSIVYLNPQYTEARIYIQLYSSAACTLSYYLVPDPSVIPNPNNLRNDIYINNNSIIDLTVFYDALFPENRVTCANQVSDTVTVIGQTFLREITMTNFCATDTMDKPMKFIDSRTGDTCVRIIEVGYNDTDMVYHTLLASGNIFHGGGIDSFQLTLVQIDSVASAEGLPNGKFCPLHDLKLVLTYKVTCCFTIDILCRYKTSWACNTADAPIYETPLVSNFSSPCASGSLRVHPNFSYPTLNVLAKKKDMNFCYGPNQLSYDTLKITNHNSPAPTDTARNIILELRQMSVNSYTDIIDSTFQIRVNSGSPVSLVPDSMVVLYTSCNNDNCYRGIYFSIPDMDSTDIVFITWRTRTCSPDDCNINPVKDSWGYKLTYHGQCGSKSSGSQYISLFAPQAVGKMTTDFNGPFDISDTVVNNVAVDLSQVSVWPSGDSLPYPERLLVKITLGQDLQFVPNTGNIGNLHILLPDLPLSCQNLFPVSDSLVPCDTASPSILYATFDISDTSCFNSSGLNLLELHNGMLYFSFMGLCSGSCAVANPQDNIDTRIYYIPDTTCTPPPLLLVGCNNVNVQLHCPGCIRKGIHSLTYDIHRTTFGFMDCDNDNRWDGDSLCQPQVITEAFALMHPEIKIRRAMVGDVLKGTLTTQVVNNNNGYGPSDTLVFPYAYWVWKVKNGYGYNFGPDGNFPALGYRLKPMDITLVFSADSSDTLLSNGPITIILPDSLLYITVDSVTQAVYHLDLSISVLNTYYNDSLNGYAYGSLPFSNFYDGLAISLTHRFRVQGNVVGNLDCEIGSTIYLGRQPEDSTFSTLVDPDPIFADTILFPNQPTTPADYDTYCDSFPSACQHFQWYCSHQGGRFTLIGWAFYDFGVGPDFPPGPTGIDTVYEQCGGLSAPKTLSLKIGDSSPNSGTNIFRFEYRNWLNVHKLKWDIPTGYIPASSMSYQQYFNLNGNGSSASTILDTSRYTLTNDSVVLNYTYIDSVYQNGVDPNISPCTNASCGSSNFGSIVKPDDEYRTETGFVFAPGCNVPDTISADFYQQMDFIPSGGSTHLLDSEPWGIYADIISFPLLSSYFDTTTYSRHDSITYIYDQNTRPEFVINANSFYNGYHSPECATITIHNTQSSSLGDATHAWFALHSDSCVTITSITVDSVVHSNPIVDSLYYFNGIFPHNSQRNVSICFNYNCAAGCDGHRNIYLFAGWDCKRTTSTVATLKQYNDTLGCHPALDTIEVRPSNAEFNAVLSLTTANPSVCDTVGYNLRAVSTSFGSVYHVVVTDTLPCSTMTYLLNSGQFIFAGDTVNEEPDTSSTSGGAQILTWNIDSISPYILANGLQGSAFDSLHSTFIIHFDIETGCGACFQQRGIAHIDYITNCSDTGMRRRNFNPLLDSTNALFNDLSDTLSVATLNACNNRYLVTVDLFNNNDSTSLRNSNYLEVTIPAGFASDSFNILPDTIIGQVLRWQLDSLSSVTFQLALDTAHCGAHNIVANLFARDTLPCGSGSCFINELASTDTISFTIDPPDSAFTCPPDTILCLEPVQFTPEGLCGYFAWDFGDSTTSNALAPTHFYDTAGTYTVTLTVYGNGSFPAGCSASSTCTVVVECPERLCGGYSTYQPSMWTKSNSCTNIPTQTDTNRCQGNYAVHYLMTSPHFTNAFPGNLVVGDTISSAMKFSTASAVRCYLKNCGGTLSSTGLSNFIPVSAVLSDPNCPTCGCANPIIQEVLALKLTVYFDLTDSNFISSPYHLAYLRIVGVPAQTLMGYTIMQVLNLADSVIAMGTSPLVPHSMTLHDLYALIRTINTSMNQCHPPNPNMYDCVPNGPLRIMMLPEDGSCQNGASANIAAFAVGGTPPFHYLWSTGDSSLVILGLSDGIYTITITDNDGTTATAEAAVKTSGDICCSNSANEFPQYPDSFNVSADSSYNVNFLPYVPVEFYESLTLSNNVLHMMEGVQLIVESGTTLILDSCELSSCGNMWKGIVVKSGGRLTLNNTIIKDAERGIYVEDGTNIYVYNSQLQNNVIGIETAANSVNVDFAIAGTTFDFADSLHGSYPGQTPFGTRPEAGIVFHNVIGTIGDDHYNENVFSDMNCGIYADGADLVITDSKFHHIHNESFYSDLLDLGGGVDAVFGSVNVTPFKDQDSLNPSFRDCDYGVILYGMNAAIVTGCNMDSMGVGISEGLSSDRAIVFMSNNISATYGGIEFSQNDSPDTLYVGYNTIATYGNVGVCIGGYLTNGGAKNFIVEENTLSCVGSQYGIDLEDCYDANVYHNTVQEISPGSPGFTGINISGGGEPIVSCNTVNGLSSEYGGEDYHMTCGICVSVCDSGIIHCNSVDSTTYGIAFLGPCFYSDMKGNEMNEHYEGLYLNENGLIDEQDNAGNLWFGPFGSGYGADNINVGLGAIVTASLFVVHEDSVSDYYPPIPDYDSTWFQVNDKGEPYSCADKSECPGMSSMMSMMSMNMPSDSSTGIAPSTLDNSIANGYTLSLAFVPETKSMGRQSLFKKLTDIPALLDSSSALNNFYTAYSDSSIKLLQQVRDSIFEFNNYGEYYLNSCRTIDSAMKIISDNIVVLDSMTNSDGQNAAVYIAQKGILRGQANILKGNMLTLRSQMRSILQSKVSSAISLNANITSQYLPESNEQIINNIYLETVAIGNNKLNSSQASTALDIAMQCPYAGGKAVYRARALYRLVNARMQYNDDSTCFVSSIFRMGNHSSVKEIEEGKIQLIPNPANDNVTVIYQTSSEGTCELYLSDITGKVVKQIGIPCDKQKFTFSISDIKSGLYLVNVINGDQSIGRSKFAIMR